MSTTFDTPPKTQLQRVAGLHHKKREAIARRFEKAASLIEQGWIRNDYAADADGKPVMWRDPRACRFCAVGSIHKAFEDYAIDAPGIYPESIAHQVLSERRDDVSSVIEFNDNRVRNRLPIVKLMRECAERVRQAGQ